MRLTKYLGLVGVSQAEMARRLGVSPMSVSRWCAGVSIPSRAVMSRIKAETEDAVQPESFYLEDPDE